MKRSRLFFLTVVFALIVTMLAVPVPVAAQEDEPAESEPQPLVVYTDYPSQMIGFGEVVTLTLQLKAGKSQIVDLEVEDLPEGWDASFRGGSKIVESVYVSSGSTARVDLRLEPPADVEAGEFELRVIAVGQGERSEIPLKFKVAEKLPPRLSLTVDGLPTKRGTPSTTFNFPVDLTNDGGEDLLVALSADAPRNMLVTFESGGQEITELELPSSESKKVTVKAEPLISLPAGSYPIAVRASAGDLNSELELVAEVVGEGNLTITTQDGRLSAEAVAGEETPLKIFLVNGGTAPLRGIELTSSAPSGWTVTFDQEQIAEIPAGESVEVTATIKPAAKAIAGDYMVTINARPIDSRQESAEFRITVTTSTLWGVAGIGMIAVAVGVVGLAVARFGRR
jgi:uncharacterized membrane protein